jgi:KaiC/GvpD/RAD55 family RecA-like ATPase
MDKYGIDYEKIFFLYFLEKPAFLRKIYKGFFSNPDLDLLAQVSKDFQAKFSEPPSRDQLKILVRNLKEKREMDDDLIDAVFQTDIKQYDEDWLDRTSKAWVSWKYFDKKLISTIEFVKLQDVSPDNVEKVVQQAIGMINDGKLSFDNNFGLDFFNPEDHILLESSKISSGRDFVDRVTGGGYDPKSLVVYAGEQNIGKSIWLANDACNFVRMGHNTVYITAEMAPAKVIRRIGANLLDIPMFDYAKKSADRQFIKRKLEKVSNGLLPPGKLFVKEFPTSQASVVDVETYLKGLEEANGIKMKCIVIDYINILANYRNPNSENTYLKIKQIAEDLRAMAVRNEWLIITATQITRSGWDATEITMSNIAESAGLAHTADMMYAIIQDSMMHANREYWLKILKIRDGEGKGSKCRFEINYDYMRLRETSDVITN